MDGRMVASRIGMCSACGEPKVWKRIYEDKQVVLNKNKIIRWKVYLHG